MTLEAELPIKKDWVKRTETAKSSVDIDRGGVNSDQSGNTWGFKRSKKNRRFRMLIGYHLFRLSEDLPQTDYYSEYGYHGHWQGHSCHSIREDSSIIDVI